MVRTSHNTASTEPIGHIFGFFPGEAINDASISWMVGLDEVDHIINHILCPFRFWSNGVIEIVPIGRASKELIVCSDAKNSGTIFPNTLRGGGSHGDERNMWEVHLENAKLRVVGSKIVAPLAAKGREDGTSATKFRVWG